MELDYKMFPRNIKGVSKGLEIYRFGIVEYSIKSESACIVALWD